MCVKDKWSDRVDYMYRLMRIETEKARERMESGKAIDPVQKSSQGKTREVVSEQFGISHDTMRKEIQIVENKRRVYKKFRIHKMCSIYSKSVHTTQKERDIHIISCAISTKNI